jgi:Mrp family chromosome partitioning ATPase
LVVVRAERSHRRIVEQAREGLFSVGARVFGAVVNAVPYGKSRYGYYAGYYGHGQGRWEKDGDSTAIVKRPLAVPKL